MASRPTPLTVAIAPTALNEISAIWRWNADEYGVSHADRYIDFLTDAIYSLATTHSLGRMVDGRPDLRYIVIKRRSRGHGHVAVYTVDEEHVNLLHVFHTAQDWPSGL